MSKFWLGDLQSQGHVRPSPSEIYIFTLMRPSQQQLGNLFDIKNKIYKNY